MSETFTAEQLFTDEVAYYARQLQEAGFTVYGHINPRMRVDGQPVPEKFFHYSREVDGRTCWGTFQFDYFGEASHSMPIKPSRLNGSGAHIGGPAVRGVDPVSVAYAEAVARPSNYCPFNAPVTEEATRRANGNSGVPQRFYTGTVLDNAEPWGIGTTYVELAKLVNA
jgi:hypothetical protein